VTDLQSVILNREMLNRRKFSKPLRMRIFCLLTVLSLFTMQAMAEIVVELSRNSISVDESFQLILRSDGATDSDPDLSVLEQDFRILGQSQSQNIQMINGQVNRSTSWNLTLMAKSTGSLTIPEISFGNASSKPLSIMVNQAAPPQQGLSGDDIFVKTEVRPRRAYQGQQILFSVHLYRAVTTDNASLSAPEADDPDILIRKLGEDEQYESQIGNRRYLVVERHYALFTQKSGTLNLAPVVFQGEVMQPGSRRDGLFGTPFGRFGRPGEIRRVQSNPISITIDAPPALAAGRPWLPSSNLQLVENWGERKQLRVGEPVTRTLMLFADGLTAAQLPELAVELPEGLKQYPDQPSLNDRESRDGITGIRQTKIAIVPSRSGQFTLPAIELDWWNLTKQRMETARIPEQRIEVLPAPFSEPGPVVTPPPQQTAEAQPQETEILSGATTLSANWLVGLVLFLGLGWLTTLGAWWYSRRQRGTAPVSHPPPVSIPVDDQERKTDLQALRAACLANQPEETAKALLGWGRTRWPKSPPRTLGAIADHSSDPELKKEIAELERHLYAGARNPWQGAKLWQHLETKPDAGDKSAKVKEPIAPLYPD